MSAKIRDDLYLYIEAKRHLAVDDESATWYDELVKIREILDSLISEGDASGQARLP